MSHELFPVDAVKMDSPRLAWLKKHGVVTYLAMPDDPHWRLWYAGFSAWSTEYSPHLKSAADLFFYETADRGDKRIGTGETEDDAIAELAKKYRLKLWNEEAEGVK
jgi:hypothetical protein